MSGTGEGGGLANVIDRHAPKVHMFGYGGHVVNCCCGWEGEDGLDYVAHLTAIVHAWQSSAGGVHFAIFHALASFYPPSEVDGVLLDKQATAVRAALSALPEDDR